MNVYQEELAMNRFRKLYLQFPVGDLFKTEAPDFILALPNGAHIGIEITHLHQEAHAGISLTPSQVDMRSKITKGVIDKLQMLFPWHFAISIDLDYRTTISKSKMNYWIDATVRACVEEFSGLLNHDSVRITNFRTEFSTITSEVVRILSFRCYRNLPNIIENINIMRFDEVSESWDSGGGGLISSELRLDDLTYALNSKEGKLKQYKPCYMHWLLIAENGYFSEIKIDIPIQSKFDKVFFLRQREDSVIDLK